MLGYDLHPLVEDTLPRKKARVAELSTGTGVFLEKLSEKLSPTAEFHGFDRSGNAFPSFSSPNVHLHVHDAFDPFPSQWHNAFDAVHIRLMLDEMQKLSDWILMARNALQILKPGGKLQWCECNMKQTRQVLRDSHGARIDSTMRVCELAYGAALWVSRSRIGLFNADGDWDLVEVLKGIGMESVEQDVAGSDRIAALRKYTSWEAIGAGFTIIKKAKEQLGLSDGQIVELEQNVERELDGGAYVRYNVHVVIGTKASTSST